MTVQIAKDVGGNMTFVDEVTTIKTLAELATIGADAVKDTMIDWGTGANQVSAVDLPIADAGAYFTTDTVEAALQEIGAYKSDTIWTPGSFTSAATHAAKRCFLLPIPLERSAMVAQLMWINGATVAGNIKCVMYADNGNTPVGGAKLFETVSAGVGAASNHVGQAVTAPARLYPRVVWVGSVVDDGTTTQYLLTAAPFLAGAKYRSCFFDLTNYADAFAANCPAVTESSTAYAMCIAQT